MPYNVVYKQEIVIMRKVGPFLVSCHILYYIILYYTIV